MGFQVLIFVMPGLDPGIHHASQDCFEEMDCRGIGERKRRRPSDGFCPAMTL
jgi:hypothetical protein